MFLITHEVLNGKPFSFYVAMVDGEPRYTRQKGRAALINTEREANTIASQLCQITGGLPHHVATAEAQAKPRKKKAAQQ